MDASHPEAFLELAAVRRLARSGRARAIRLDAGLSLRELGAPLGVSATTVRRWESGERRPAGELALRYGALLAALAQEADRA